MLKQIADLDQYQYVYICRSSTGILLLYMRTAVYIRQCSITCRTVLRVSYYIIDSDSCEWVVP